MLALSKTKAGPGAALARVDVPRIAADELLVKVERASICGSDLPIYNWTAWAPKRIKLPTVFGHEFCGTVVEPGSSTRDFKKGDFVSVESHIYCGLCPQCRNGQRHVCKNLKIIGIDAPGGFGQYARVPARCAWKHKDRKLAPVASLLEPIGNAVYAALCEEVVGKSVLVLGCGPQGLFAISAAKAGGAKPVVAVEMAPYRMRLAKRMGADLVVNPAAPDAMERIQRACDGEVDVVLEMSGAPAAVELGLKAVRSGGRVSAFGIPPRNLDLDWASDIVFKGVTVRGIAGREVFKTWYTTDALLRSKKLDPRPVVTHRFPLARFKQAFSVMNAKSKNSGKVVFEIG
ncbi:MAG: L-threonine 3-dehydrogenase [Elusimicrobia bacterium]|nr:L-threonine 3-dehydrogenase [Elusimicrobiota bacterium]